MKLLTENVVQGLGRHKLQVDREAGVIKGVKVLGYKSRNNRIYEPTALRACASLYEGVPVHFGHLTDDYGDRCGSLRNCRATDKAVYGDWHLNKGHRYYQQVMEDAEHNVRNLQLSHEVDRDNATVVLENGVEHVKAVLKVNSVAVVTNAATNESLVEEVVPMNLSDLKAKHPDLIEAVQQEALAPVKTQVTELESKLEDIAKKLAESETARTEVENQLATIQEAQQRAERIVAIRELAEGLGAGDVTDKAMEAYLLLGDEQVKTLLEAVAENIKEHAPRSTNGATETTSTLGQRDTVPSLFGRK